MAIRQVSFAAPQQAQSPLVQALAPRDPRQMLAIQALQEGTSTAPVQSIGEGLARVAQGALGGWFAGRQKRESEEASGRLADAILSSLPEDQRAGPLAMALRDPNVAPGLIPGMLQQMATRREQWTPDPTGMFQVNSVTGERRPLESPERARAMAEAGRDPNSRFQIVPGTDGQPPLVVDRSQLGGVAPGQVAQAIIGRESGGNPTAQNPMSSATGAGQFLDQTWLDMAPRLGVDPQLLARAQQGDPQARQQILALRNDPQLSARATELYVQQNGQRLQAAGIPTTPENLYLAHFLGPEGALRFLSTQPNAPVSQAVGPQAFAANRQVFTREGRELTVGEVYGAIRQDIQRRMGGTQTAQAPAQTATDAGPQYPPGVRPLVSGGSQPTFRGQGIEQQMYNRYLDLDRRRPALNPMEQQELAIVERFLTQPRTTVTDRGVETIQPPPLPRFNPQQTAATPAGPASVAPTATEPGAIAPPANGASASPPAQQPSPQPATPQGPAPRTTTLPGGAQVTTIPRTDRDPPQPIVGAMTENANAVQSIDRAMMALNRYPAAVGVRPGIANLTGWSSMIWDRMDPDGVEVRAAIADIGSLKIHDRSGAAVSAQEFPRLRPFIPQVGDSAETVRTKLLRFREEYMQMLRDQYENYGPAQGYRPLPSVERILTPPTATGQPPPVVRWRRGPNGPEPETQ